jgi:hypothetical protein
MASPVRLLGLMLISVSFFFPSPRSRPLRSSASRSTSARVEARREGLTVRSRQSFTDVSRKTQTALRAESLLYFNGREEDRRLRIELGKAHLAGRGQVFSRKETQVFRGGFPWL